jgi:hypothetical protein
VHAGTNVYSFFYFTGVSWALFGKKKKDIVTVHTMEGTVV